MNNWPAAFVSLGGFFIAALSLYFSYRDRRASHRHLFYEKQIEAYSDVVAALSEIHDSIQNFICIHKCVLNSASRLQLRKELVNGDMSKSYRHFLSMKDKWSIFLPEVFLKSLKEFISTLNGISAPDEVASQYPHEFVHSKDPGMLLCRSYLDVVAVARHGLGVEPLTKDMIRVFGSQFSGDLPSSIE